MSSQADLSENDSEFQKDDDNQDEEDEQVDKEEDEEREKDDDDDQEEVENNEDEQKGGDSTKRVTFKEDTISSVYNEVNNISQNIDQFLIKLSSSSYSNGYDKYRQTITSQQVKTNYSSQYRQSDMPQIQQNESQANKFFYTKQDMSSARMAQNSKNSSVVISQSISNPMPTQLNHSEYNHYQSSNNNSKYNYYGRYRFQQDKINQPQANSRDANQFYSQQQAQQNDIRVSREQNSNNQGYNFNKNIDNINQSVEQLAQSIHQDTTQRFYQQPPQKQLLPYQESQRRHSQTQNNIFNDSLNQRYQQQSNNIYSSQYQNKSYHQESNPVSTNKMSNQNSFSASNPQNIRDLYKHRPKRVIDESELYGDIQETFLPNKISNQSYLLELIFHKILQNIT